MTFLQAVILDCLRIINEERTVYSIYHLLKGKKSSQTIQDAHLFQLDQYFKTVPQMNRIDFDQHIKYLAQAGFLSHVNESQKSNITELGKAELEKFFNVFQMLTYMNGWKYQDTAMEMWKRLTLLIQVASHLNYKDTRYQAIQRDTEVHLWIKKFLKHYKGGRIDLSKQIYNELHLIFSEKFPENPLFIVAKLTGRGLIGLTSKQAANQMNIEYTEFHYRFLNCLHFIIEQVMNECAAYPILHAIISDIFQPVPYTKSTLRTYELLQQNMTIEEVAKVRKLRKSTIEDHIIEIALTDQQFSIDNLIDKKRIKEITEAATLLGIKKLKPIRDHINHVSYFQIRLVLARLGEKI